MAQETPPDIFYLGQKGAIEEKIARECGVPFYGIHAGKLRRYFDLRNFADVFKIPLGFLKAGFLLGRLKPDLVFAKGGYVSVPVVLAAAMLRIPVWLHESDVTPGLANKICSRFAKKIFLSFEESKRFFPHRHAFVVGNPIREWVARGDREEGYRLAGFSKNKPVVLIIGGSTGARTLNEMAFAVLPELLKSAQVVHVTGKHAVQQDPPLSGAISGYKSHYRQFEFLNKELAHIYAISDLIVGRAGSGGIFEALACGKPMILVPLPSRASRGDQIENAKVFEKNGWAVVLDQNSLTPQRFLDEIKILLNNEDLRRKMADNQKKAGLKDAASKIAEAILALQKA